MHRRAFTMVELLIASALAGMLILGVLAAITNLGRTEQQQQKAERASLPTHVIDLIRSDLVHADEMRVRDEQIELRGRLGIDRDSVQVNHMPAVVRYAIIHVNEQPWLIRRQKDPTNLSSDRTTANVIANGVSAISFTRIAIAPNDDGALEQDAKETGPAEETEEFDDMWTVVPARILLSFQIDSPDEPIMIDRELVLR